MSAPNFVFEKEIPINLIQKIEVNTVSTKSDVQRSISKKLPKTSFQEVSPWR